MKKLFFLLGGIIVLTSCSEDMIIDEQKTDLFTSDEESGSQNGIRTITDNFEYYSPWDANHRTNVKYQFDSNGANNAGKFVRVTPYIGIAYYDGAKDGTYNFPGGGSVNLASGSYPNLYAGSKEYGNYIQANPIVLAAPSQTTGWYTHELSVFSDSERNDHCPMVNVNVGFNYNLYAVRFNVINNNVVQPPAVGNTITPAPPVATTQERDLLRQFGKVFYYKVEYGNSAFTFTDTHYVLALEADPNDSSDKEWTSLALNDTPFNGDLYYHSGIAGLLYPTKGATSKEIVIDKRSVVYVYPKMQGSGDIFGTINNGGRKITTMPTHDSIPSLIKPVGTQIFFD